MNFGATPNTDALNSLGVPGLVFVILILAGVIVFLYKKLDRSQTDYNMLQEKRVLEAKETSDKITEPLGNQIKLTEKIYDLLLSSRSK